MTIVVMDSYDVTDVWLVHRDTETTMATVYHAAPASRKDDILTNGILPLARQREFAGDEEGAIQAWLTRWADRMGREVSETEDLVPMAEYDIHRVCVFTDLDTARTWAAADPREMVIFEIDAEFIEFSPDEFADEDGEHGAICTKAPISPEDIKAVE